MPEPLEGVTRQQLQELQHMLSRLSRLWAELTEAAANRDHARVDAVNREIVVCRQRLEEIKRAGTQGTA